MKYDEFLAKVEKGKGKPSATRQASNIHEAACLRVLEGNVRSLTIAFSWVSTPQGNDYWRGKCLRCEPITGDDFEFIRGLIA